MWVITIFQKQKLPHLLHREKLLYSCEYTPLLSLSVSLASPAGWHDNKGIVSRTTFCCFFPARQGDLGPSVHQMSFNPLYVLEQTLVMGRRRGRGSPIRKPTDHTDRGPAYPSFWSAAPYSLNGPCLAYTCAIGSSLQARARLKQVGSDCFPLKALCLWSASIPEPLTTMRGRLCLCTCRLHVLLWGFPGAGYSRGCVW